MVEKIIEDGSRFSFNIQVYKDLIVVSLSCESNVFECNQMLKLFAGKLSKAIIFNTCAVTTRYVRIVTEYVNRLKKYYPDYTIYLTGCGSNFYPDAYKDLGIIVPDKEKFLPQSYGLTEVNIGDNDFATPKIGVQTGCSHQCTYCVTRLVKGKSVSKDYASIYKCIEGIRKVGWDKVIIAGIDLTEYYSDGMYLSDLCRRILKDFPDITIQTNNLDPAAPETLKMIELIKEEPRMQPVVHLPIQSGSNKILKLMKRRHKAEDLEKIYDSIKGTNITTYWDLIVGFPGETEEDFQATCDIIKRYKPTSTLVLPCCLHKGTEAYDMDNRVPLEIAEQRMNIVHELVDQNSIKHDSILTVKFTEENWVHKLSYISNRETILEHKKVILDFRDFEIFNSDIIILLDNLLYCNLFNSLEIVFSNKTNRKFASTLVKTLKNNNVMDEKVRLINEL